MSKNTDIIEKYKHLTIEQLKNLGFQGQGQTSPNAPLWQTHINQSRDRIL